jgi:hypothetical protein
MGYAIVREEKKVGRDSVRSGFKGKRVIVG